MRKRAAREHLVRELRKNWSGYRSMWTLVLFDLPVKTKEERRTYSRFRKFLLELGLTKMQFSVYCRCVPNDEKAEALSRRIRPQIPEHGEVRILQITGKQFEKMQVFFGKKKRDPEKEPRQLELF